jgi:polyhydroxyalkanoate synthase
MPADAKKTKSKAQKSGEKGAKNLKKDKKKIKKLKVIPEKVVKAKAAPKPAEKPTEKPKAKPQVTESAKTPPPGPDAASAIDMETLTQNIAKAAMISQKALTDAALAQAQSGHVDPDPLKLSKAMADVSAGFAANPEHMVTAQTKLAEGYMKLWTSAAQRMAGLPAEPVAEPAKGDRRFADAQWQDNPVFDVLKQAYLLNANWMADVVANAPDVDDKTKRKLTFFTKQFADAMSPTNMLMTNPAAMKAMWDSKGESVAKGAERFAKDLERGNGRLAISQADAEKFTVGENVASTPGHVVFRNDIIELIQYTPTTDQVHERPIVIYPPWINKFYILDLRPENSLIRWLVGQGYTVFLTSWVNPTPELAHKTFADYMREGIYAARDAVTRQTGVEKPHAVGYCIGGTLLSCTMAHMAATGDRGFESTTFFAAQQDFSEAGDLTLFIDDEWVSEIERRMDANGGVLAGRDMADTFNALRANDLIWSFYVNNYLLGKDLPAFDLLFWNSDQTRMPRTLHSFYLRQFYLHNRLSKGELELDGVRLDLGTIKTPIYVQAAREDHIAPALSVYKGARLFGGPVTYTLAGSGHIAGVINHPDANKYQHWENSKLPATLDEWQAGAKEVPGSWWTHWNRWLAPRSGPQIAARDETKGPLKPLCPAPGTYVAAP